MISRKSSSLNFVMAQMVVSSSGLDGSQEALSARSGSPDNVLTTWLMIIPRTRTGAALDYITARRYGLRPAATTSHSLGHTHFFQLLDSLVTARTSD